MMYGPRWSPVESGIRPARTTIYTYSLLKTSAEVLEFESLRQLVRRYIASPLGQREWDKVQPHSDRARLVEDLAETGEGIEYLRLAARPQPAARGAAIRIDFNGLPDTEATV